MFSDDKSAAFANAREIFKKIDEIRLGCNHAKICSLPLVLREVKSRMLGLRNANDTERVITLAKMLAFIDNPKPETSKIVSPENPQWDVFFKTLQSDNMFDLNSYVIPDTYPTTVILSDVFRESLGSSMARNRIKQVQAGKIIGVSQGFLSMVKRGQKPKVNRDTLQRLLIFYRIPFSDKLVQ